MRDTGQHQFVEEDDAFEQRGQASDGNVSVADVERGPSRMQDRMCRGKGAMVNQRNVIH